MLVVLFTLSLFAAKLVQVQGLEASSLAEAALRQNTASLVLPAHRGDITDIDGSVLATTVERRNITVDQKQVPTFTRVVDGRKEVLGVAGAAAALAPVLNIDVATLTATLTGTRRFAYVARAVTPDVWRRVALLRIPGIGADQASTRVYPGRGVGAVVVGFVGKDGVPRAGIELAQKSVLAGRPGSITYEQGLDGRMIPTGLMVENEPVPGTSVRLNIDRDLQWKAQDLLAAQVAATGAQWGSAIVVDPRTGDVLALATSPTFDANDPAAAPQEDRGDRALLDVFEPGSTSKVVTAAAALETGKVTPATRFVVPGTLRRGGKTFHDSHSHGPERLTFAGVLAKSSNIGTIMAGERVDPATMYDFMTRFGLGSRTGVGLPESGGILAAAADWNRSQRYTVLFGQGLALTALQSTEVFATIANDGVRMPPRLVAGTTGPDGVFHPAEAPPGVRAISAKTARTLRLMMESVVSDEGTARLAEIPGYRVAGKTGTAQAPDSSCGCYRGFTASFIGMAPADAPRLVVSIVLQRPTNGHYGGTVAAPVFRDLMSYALAHQRIPPTGTKAPTLPLTYK